MTPEGRVKRKISDYLDSLGDLVYKIMFVPTGYGRRNQLDYTLCLYGQFVAIEAKAPGEWLTELQRITCRTIYRAGGAVFIISGPEGLAALKRWVDRHAR
jgi:hypothetical protein